MSMTVQDMLREARRPPASADRLAAARRRLDRLEAYERVRRWCEPTAAEQIARVRRDLDAIDYARETRRRAIDLAVFRHVGSVQVARDIFLPRHVCHDVASVAVHVEVSPRPPHIAMYGSLIPQEAYGESLRLGPRPEVDEEAFRVWETRLPVPLPARIRPAGDGRQYGVIYEASWVRALDRDPILVELRHGLLWIIGHWGATDFERWLLKEFAVADA